MPTYLTYPIFNFYLSVTLKYHIMTVAVTWYVFIV